MFDLNFLSIGALIVATFVLLVVGLTRDNVHKRSADYRKRHGPGFVNRRGMWLKMCNFIPDQPPRGVVLLCHGYGDYYHTDGFGLKTRGFSTVPPILVANGFACFGIEYQGCGRSEGVRCYVDSFDHFVDDVLQFVKIVRDRHPEYANSKFFIVGQSMGGAVAIQTVRRWSKELPDVPLAGLVLIAPMCSIDTSMIPAWPVMKLLTLASYVMPTAALIPSDTDVNSRSVKDEKIRERAVTDKEEYNGQTRLRMGLELLTVTQAIQRGAAADISCPILLCQGEDDIVCNPKESAIFVQATKSKDKTIKLYSEHWHGTLDEPGPKGGDLVRKDILEWLQAHV